MFRMTVDDVFSIRGRGTVVTGKIDQGSLRPGDEVRINQGPPTRVDGIEAFRKILDYAEAGTNVGLLFKKLNRGDVDRGDIITGADDHAERAEPVEPPAPTAISSAPSATRDPRFAQVEEQRAQFEQLRAAGLMDEAQMDQALQELAFDFEGRRWMLRADHEGWYSSRDGRDFSRDTPPR